MSNSVTKKLYLEHIENGIELKDGINCLRQREAIRISKKLISTLTHEQKTLFSLYTEHETAVEGRACEVYYERGFFDAIHLLIGAMN